MLHVAADVDHPVVEAHKVDVEGPEAPVEGVRQRGAAAGAAHAPLAGPGAERRMAAAVLKSKGGRLTTFVACLMAAAVVFSLRPFSGVSKPFVEGVGEQAAVAPAPPASLRSAMDRAVGVLEGWRRRRRRRIEHQS